MTNHGMEQRKLAAIMFTDMVGYSALAQRNEALSIELLEEHRRLLRTLFPRFEGAEIKTIGDAFLVEFQSALAATQCAIEIQRALAKRNADAPADKQIQIRIGIHIGDVVHRDGDVYGDGVNIASRIEPLAGPGGICLSMDVERQIRNSLEIAFVRLGPTDLKNIQLPMELFRIVLPWETKASAKPAISAPGRPASLWSRLYAHAWVSLVIVMLSLGCVGGFTYWLTHRTSRESEAPPQKSSHITSLAVKPLDDFSNDTNQFYLADGMTEILTRYLCEISALRVPGRSSVMRYKGSNKTIQEIAQELKVDAIIEGSIQRAGNRVRVTVQLIEAATDRHLWAKDYDRDLSDFFKVQSELAQAIAAEIKVKLTTQDHARLDTARSLDSDAVTAYLRGRYFWNKRTADDLKRALEYFNQAIVQEPSYALAYAGLASTYVILPEYTNLSPKDVIPKAKAAATKALEIDSSLAEAHSALALIQGEFEGDFKEAEQSFKQAIELSPNYSTAHHWYGILLRAQGRFEEAMVETKKAQALDPLSPVISINVATILAFQGDYTNAIQQCHKVLEFDPQFAPALKVLGRILSVNQQYAEAISVLRQVRSITSENVYGLGDLGYALGRIGQREEALRILAQLQEFQQKGFAVQESLALVYLGLGDKEQCLDCLEKVVSEHGITSMEIQNGDKRLDSIRSEPRFIQILQHWQRRDP